MSNAVRLSLAVDADTADAAAAFDKVGAAAKDMANDVDTAARDADSSVSGFTDSADNAGSAAQTAAGAFGDLGGALSMVPGPLGGIGAAMETTAPLIQGVTGATDLLSLAMNSSIVTTIKNTAVTIAQTVATTAASAASKAMAVAQWALNVAMEANPIGLIVIALVALVAGLILAYNKSETFRGIIDKLGATVATVFTAIIGWIQKVISWVADKLGPVFTVYAALVKTEIGIVTTVIKGIVDAVEAIVGPIKNKLEAILAKIQDVFGWDPSNALSKAWGGIKAIMEKPFTDAWSTIEGIFGPGGKIAGIGGAAVTAVTNAANAIIDVVNKLISAFNKLPGPNIPSVPHIGSSSVAGASGRTVAPVVGARTVGGVAVPAGGVTINIYGAIDPYQTAQQIKRVMARGAIISGRRGG